MATTEACDKLWAASTIDQESSAYTYAVRRPEWRTKISPPTVVREESTRTEQPQAQAQPQPGPTSTQNLDLPPPYERNVHHGNWTMKFNNAFTRTCSVSGKCEDHYGISEDGGSKPDTYFVCKRGMRAGGKWIDYRCWQVLRELLRHRAKNGRNCHCDFEYIKTGRTRRDTSRLCNWRPGTTGKSVLKEMRKHDKKCGCDAFEYPNNRLGL